MPVSTKANPEPGANAQLAWNLDWNLLRTFMVIAQKKNITSAALSLGLKQPTVSNALKRLESTLGCRLVERGPRSFELTDQGRALYRECAGIFGSVNRLSSALTDARDKVQGVVNLAMASHVICPLLDETLEKFHRAYPAASVSIAIINSHKVIASVLEKKAGLGICLVDQKLPRLDYQLLYTEHFGFFCGPHHRLFGRPGLKLSDLRGEQCVSFRTDLLTDALRPIAILRAQAEFSPHIPGTSTALEEIRRMVIAGLGIGALPIHVVERDVQDGQLYRLPPYKNPPAVDIWLVRNPDARLNPAEHEFTRILMARIEQTPKSERSYGHTLHT